MKYDARMRRRLKLRDLDTLLTIAKTGSMAKAATELSVSQPAVSKAVAEMEHTIGVRLLDRTAQGAVLNLYGQALLKWAQAAFDDIRQGVKEIEFLADPTAGELRIGATEPIVAGVLPVILERLRLRYPRLLFQVRQMAAVAQQYNELREHKVDIILGRMLKPVEEDLSVEILFHERTFVVANSNNRLCRRRKIELSELTKEPWSMPPPDTVVGLLTAEAFRARGLDIPQGSVVTASIELHSALMAHGPYLAILPSSMLHFSGKRLSLQALPVDLQIAPWPVSITTLKNRTISPISQLFIKHAYEVAKPLAKLYS